MTISIRRAIPLDIDWLLQELRAFADFAQTKFDLMGDADHAKDAMLAVIKDHLVFIAECAERGPVGFIAGWISGHPFNPKLRTLSEMFWWVREAFRSSRAGLLLLNAFTEWGLANCQWITMALEAHSPVNPKSLEKRGYRLFETSYLLEAV
jgi:hypothetical protein